MLAIDYKGNMSGACTTSGMAFKMNTGGVEPLPQPPAFFDLQGANTIAGAIGRNAMAAAAAIPKIDCLILIMTGSSI